MVEKRREAELSLFSKQAHINDPSGRLRCSPRKRRPAYTATSTRTRPRPCSGKAPPRPRLCWWASSRATKRTWPGVPSSAPPARCSTTPLKVQALTVQTSMSQCGEALQARAARQAPHSQKARHQRDRRLPLVARPRARDRPTSRVGGAGRDGGTRADPESPDHQRQSRPPHCAARWAARRHHYPTCSGSRRNATSGASSISWSRICATRPRPPRSHTSPKSGRGRARRR
jgi:hypothetical protein